MKDSLDSLIVALCADYERRKLAITEGVLPNRILAEFKYLNSRILEAAAEVVGSELCEIFILEIGERRGYAFTDADKMSETTYKKKKQEVKRSVARRLHLDG